MKSTFPIEWSLDSDSTARRCILIQEQLSQFPAHFPFEEPPIGEFSEQFPHVFPGLSSGVSTGSFHMRLMTLVVAQISFHPAEGGFSAAALLAHQKR